MEAEGKRMEPVVALSKTMDYYRDYLLGSCQGLEPLIRSKDVYLKIENALGPL